MSSSFSPGNDLYNPLYLSHCQHTGYERENDIYLDVWKFTRDEIVVGGLFLKISWRKCLYFIRAVARINESAGKPFVPNCCDTILESESWAFLNTLYRRCNDGYGGEKERRWSWIFGNGTRRDYRLQDARRHTGKPAILSLALFYRRGKARTPLSLAQRLASLLCLCSFTSKLREPIPLATERPFIVCRMARVCDCSQPGE